MPNGSSVAATEGLLGLGRVLGDDVHVDRTASRTARLITDPRRSSLRRDRRLAPNTSCVQFSAGRTPRAQPRRPRNDLVVLASEVGKELLVAHEILRPRPGHSFGRTDVQAEQFPVRVAPCVRPGESILRFPARR
jgi:hypothetical protein